MKYFKKIVGDRIYLSPKSTFDEDVEKYTKWMNDFQVTDYIGGSSKIVTYNGEKEWLDKMAKNREDINFDIVTLDEDKLIGTVSLDGFNFTDRSAVLGIFIGEEDYRSHGYGTEAIKLMLEYGFKYLKLSRLLDKVSRSQDSRGTAQGRSPAGQSRTMAESFSRRSDRGRHSFS